MQFSQSFCSNDNLHEHHHGLKLLSIHVQVLLYIPYIYGGESELLVQELSSAGPSMRGVASYSAATCTAGILIWRLPFSNDTSGEFDLSMGLLLRNVPMESFDVLVWQLDDGHRPQVHQLLSAGTFEIQLASSTKSSMLLT